MSCELETLREEVRQLRRREGHEDAIPIEWGFSRLEARALACLLMNEYVSGERLFNTLHCDKVKQPQNIYASNATIGCLRRKIKKLKLDIPINTRAAWGFWIPREHRKRLLAEIALMRQPC